MDLSSLSEEKLITLLQVMNNFDEINYFFMNNDQNKIGIIVKLIWKVLMRWKELKRFHGSRFDNFREEDWSNIKTRLMTSRPDFRNYRVKLIVWMIRGATTRRIGYGRSSTNSLYRESLETIQRPTSQAEELQERMNYLKDSGGFQEVESNCSGKNLTCPVNQQGFQVRALC